jgi:hypothetical protein
MKARVIIIVLLVVFIISSCRNASKKPEELVLAGTGTLTETGKSGSNVIDEIYRNYSSSLEIANLFQVAGVPFSSSYLALSLNASDQTTSFEKALYLGILGADLGYLNMYEKTGTSMELVASIKILAEGLNVGQFFDFENIKRLSLNQSDLDSLLFLSLDSYKRIDEYLRENNRSHLSTLIIIGAWIEAQYFATQVVKQYPEKLLKDRIGEQKIFLSDLITIVSPYCGQDEKFFELCNYLRNISAKYDNVKISFTQGDPIRVEKDSGLVITQNDFSNVDMTDEQLAAIIDITGDVRNKLIAKR